MKLIFDTETTGLPIKTDRNLPSPTNTEAYNSARLIELAYTILDKNNFVVKTESFLVSGLIIENVGVHGITTEMCKDGLPIKDVLEKFKADVSTCEILIGHNIEFDISIIEAEHFRLFGTLIGLEKKKIFCTMKIGSKITGKYPKLSELHSKFFPEDVFKGHRALKDVYATKKCYFALNMYT